MLTDCEINQARQLRPSLMDKEIAALHFQSDKCVTTNVIRNGYRLTAQKDDTTVVL